MAHARVRRRAHSRRGGQALLLAVLLMVFAALLGSTFLAIVSSNVNQGARQGELASARQSAQAGLSFVNDRLTNSPEGERWRPWKVLGAPPPRAGERGFDIYYNSTERSKGWVNEVDFNNIDPSADLNLNGITYGQALSTSNRPEQDEERHLHAEAQMLAKPAKRCFVKFPDPRGPATNANGPQYLAEVRPEVLPGTSTPSGQLRITIIGQSEDSPNTFHTRVALKNGLARNPLFAAARTVTNWDFASSTVPEAQVASLAGSDLNITNKRGGFPAAPFYVTIGGVTSPLHTAQVVAVISPTQLRLSAPMTPAPLVGDRVQLAAPLGAPSGIDYDADGLIQGTATDASGRRVLYGREAVAWSSAESALPYTLQARVNGGLIWMGNTVLPNNAQVMASGLMALRNVGPNPALPRTTAFNGYSARLTDSRDPNFPIFQAQDENGSPISQPQAQKSIRDGLDVLRNIPNTPRNISHFVPPSITPRAGDVDRYRELSKFSAPNVNITAYGSNPAGGSGALYGYGEGVYIDNAQDREQATTTIAGVTSARAMTSSQLKQMIFGTTASTSASLATSFQRRVRPYGVGQKQSVGGVPQVPTLEQKHQRGWIGPDEFRARGALIELAPNERFFALGPNDERTIYVTLDALSDAGPHNNGTDVDEPDPRRSYRWADGSLPTGATRYRRRLPWPQNGVIFAEGNVRLRGGAFNANGRADSAVDPHRGLTIVTMGNAYIEGSLNAGTRKIAILARQNVILNPTAIVSRVEAQTTLRASMGTPPGSIVQVDDGTLFQVGDWVEVNNGGPFRVTGTADTALSLSPRYRGTTTNPILRAAQDPVYESGQDAFPYFDNATRLGKASDMAQRRFPLVPGSAQVRLSLRHSAFRREAFQVRAERNLAGPNLPPDYIDLSSKLISGADAQTSIIPPASKYLRVDWGTAAGGAGAPDLFSNTVPADGNALKNNLTFRLGATPAPLPTPTPNPPITMPNGIEKQIEDTSANPIHAPRMWSYNAAETKPLNRFDSLAGGASPLWFFLAASSNRHSFGYNLASGEALHRKQSIRDATASLPLGTSITAFFNTSSAPSTITSDHFNPSTSAFDERVGQFGFNPQLDGPEDALTMDETFYTSHVGATVLPTPAPSTNPEQIALDFDITDYALDTRTFSIAAPSPGVQNTLSLTMNNQNVKVSSTQDTGQAPDYFFQPGRAKIPYYRLSRLKLDTPDTPAAPVFDPSSGQLAKIAPGATMEVQAFVYAQEGSWMVIAGDFFDRTLQTEPTSPPVGPPGSYIARPNGTRASIDLNRDEVVTRDELTGVYRLRRYNYKIVFRGSIMENQALPVVPEGPEPGAVSEWMDKWAAFQFTSANGDFDDTRRDGIADSTATTRRPQPEAPLNDANPRANFGNITYEFDPSVTSNLGFSDTGFRPPISPELVYVT